MPTLEQVHAQIKALPHKYIFYTKKEIKYLPRILDDDEQILALTSGFMNNTTWLAVCTNRRVIFLDKGMFFGLKQVQMNLDRVQSIDSSYTLVFGSIRLWDGASSFVLQMVLKESVQPFVSTVRKAIENYRRIVFHEMRQEPMRGHPMSAPQQHVQQQTAQPQIQQQAHHTQPALTHEQKMAAVRSAELKSKLGTNLKPMETPDLRDNDPAEPNPLEEYVPAASAPTAPASSGGVDIADQLERLVKLKEAGHLTDEEFAAQKAKLIG